MTTTINLSLPSGLLKLVDQEAKAELRSRSELFREAARAYLAREQKWKALQNYGKERARTFGIRTEADISRLVALVRRSSRSPKS